MVLSYQSFVAQGESVWFLCGQSMFFEIAPGRVLVQLLMQRGAHHNEEVRWGVSVFAGDKYEQTPPLTNFRSKFDGEM